jgi:predicted Zn-dependent protease
MSQQLAAQGIGSLGNVALGGSGAAANVFSAVFAPGAQVGVLLPNSRKQELEADHYGLIFAAMAGYNPQEAIPFWQRMMSLNQGGRTPTFLSDHPADQQRIQELQGFMPEALKYYRPVK